MRTNFQFTEASCPTSIVVHRSQRFRNQVLSRTPEGKKQAGAVRFAGIRESGGFSRCPEDIGNAVWE